MKFPTIEKNSVLPRLLLLGVFVALARPAHADNAPDASQDVVVYSTVFPAGKNATPPTADHPVYYLPDFAGYHTAGSVSADWNDKKVTPEMVWARLHKALLSQHYINVDRTTPAPTMLLVFHWGQMAPNEVVPFDDSNSSDPDNPTGPPAATSYDSNEMQSLIGSTPPEHGHLHLPESAHDDAMADILSSTTSHERYFITLTAFDYAEAMKSRKVRLWAARLSCDAAKTNLKTSLAPLATAGAPFFGRDSGGGQFIAHDSNVSADAPKVIEYLPDEKNKATNQSTNPPASTDNKAK